MGEHKLQSTAVRDALRHAEVRRLKRIQNGRSVAVFHTIPHRTSLSTRGETGQTWRTKRWTKMRRQDRNDWLEHQRKLLARSVVDEALDRAEHVRRQGDDPHPRAASRPIPYFWRV